LEIKAQQDTLTIDPIALNVVNRVASGTRLDGTLHFDGGLLVQGELSGDITVNGRLIVWGGGSVRGNIHVKGDLYLFGQLGATGAAPEDTHLKCMGCAFVANTGVATGTLLATRLSLYEGADLRGPFRTIKSADNFPVLRQVTDTVA
jgi:hypothetical protein